MEVKLQNDIPVPVVKPGRKSESYPFGIMNVGDSFFIADREGRPDVGKSMASTVASAMARYAVPATPAKTRINRKGKEVPVMIKMRKFIVRKVTENGVTGARIWRTK